MPLLTRQGYQRVESVDAEEDGSPGIVEDVSPPTESTAVPSTIDAEITPDEQGDTVVSSQQSTAVHIDASPPPYMPDGRTQQGMDDDLDPCPPKYGDIVKLPTYEEVELNHPINIDNDDYMNELHDGTQTNGESNQDGMVLGTDLHFIFAFFFSFFFSVIGFLMSYCLSSTISGRYGALSGFGLSLVKAGFLFKISASHQNEAPMLTGIFAMSGMVIFIHGIFAYIRVKRAAAEISLTRSPQFM